MLLASTLAELVSDAGWSGRWQQPLSGWQHVDDELVALVERVLDVLFVSCLGRSRLRQFLVG